MVNMLQKKIVRDIFENRASLLAIVVVCTLGAALFSGLNLYVSSIEEEIDSCYTQANLADYWIYKPTVTEADLERIRALPETASACRRKMAEGSVAGNLNAILKIHALEDTPEINIPESAEGEPFDPRDNSSIWIDTRFAEENNLRVGGSVKISVGEQTRDWLVRGLVRNAEYIYYAPDGLALPDYKKYGFAYVGASALESPYNELLICLAKDTADAPEKITAQIRGVLGNVNVISRGSQPSVSNIAVDIAGIKRIGGMLPLVFFLTAALVTWITVGRMMELGRQNLGILRSVGFSKKEIMARYAVYGALITVPSAILGGLISRLLAEYIYSLGILYYSIDAKGVKMVSWHFIVSVLCVALVTCGAALLSCKRALAWAPAALMRPKPPARGHRILAERITPFWRRLSFSGKIVTRNLFRGKTRLFMGLVGVAGSAALLVCGFGLNDSMTAMIASAFEKTIQYNAEIKLKRPMPLEEIRAAIEGAEHIDTAMAFTVYIYGEGGLARNPYLVILEDGQSSLYFTDENGMPVSMPGSGALITPRMAEALGTGIGGAVAAERLDGTKLVLKISGIVDFPVGDEIYIGRTAFKEISGLEFTPMVFFVKGQRLDTSVLESDSRVSLIETREEMEENLKVLLRFLWTIRVILIIFAAGLAFTVMMMLGRLNYHERAGELATLKVLGFRRGEMKRLVLRESVWITLFGLPPGLALGFALLRLLLRLSATPDSQARPFVSPLSCVLVCALTLGFTLFVNFLIGRKFKAIDMVSALKSVE
ncbi:MAG: ABC transporter permease [Clostridiales bacterium]|jgi:putative ABC transport system permease protein|nr:ABC transporter permease [Clostridiales bacterium]